MDPYLLLAAVMLFVSWRLLRPRSERIEKATSEHLGLSQEQRLAASTEIARMELRLVEQHRELEAALQTRVAMLDTLIADADERIADLRQQLEFSDRRRAA